jgi:LuxR family maltose regulon positive regulatory protein
LSTPLLSTKSRIPRTGSKLVDRERFWRILDEGLEQGISLILVCGPACYGKTTLVSEWLRAFPKVHPDQFAWLTLGRSDDDLTLFLLFVRRDIRLSGEGNWHLPFLTNRKRTA